MCSLQGQAVTIDRDCVIACTLVGIHVYASLLPRDLSILNAFLLQTVYADGFCRACAGALSAT